MSATKSDDSAKNEHSPNPARKPQPGPQQSQPPAIAPAAFHPFQVELGRPPQTGAVAGALIRKEERLFNRDLSWLHFNDRVLSEAADPSVPPLERLRFATIVSSNLDEFFMVRVAEIVRISRRQPSYRFPDSLSASQVLAQIREQVLQQKSKQSVVLDQILEALKSEGIQIYHDFEAYSRLDRRIQKRLPKLTLCVRRASEPLPELASSRIHVFVRFPGAYAIIAIEEREKRLIDLSSYRPENSIRDSRPRGGLRGRQVRRYALAERWLSARARKIFPDREVIEAFPFKIIRDADLRYRPDDEASLEEQILDAIEKRRRAKVVRLEVDAPTYSEGALFLATALRLDSAGLYRFDLPLDLRTLALLYNEKGADKLRYSPIQPQIPVSLRKTTPRLDSSGQPSSETFPRATVFDGIRKKDILLHHPYDSFDIVVKFIEAAAADPQVAQINHTMYRTSRESPIVTALQEAARRGKKVAVYIEIKARFDEANNVRVANELRRSGVKVVRPLGRFKVHSKLTQIVRNEEEGERSYLHLGTGNYHPVTARQYTDLGLLTCDQELGKEVTSYFHSLSTGGKPAGYKELMVAPGDLYHQILQLIRQETQIQLQGGKGRIIAKINSLVDPDIIEALYAASQAGVSVDLLVRGICCLLPGIKGLSENIRVVSVIDRFLEHSRVYYFRSGGEEKLFLSSADWMPRNFFTRYELAFPVKDPALKKYILDVILAKGLADNVKAWGLKPDGSYSKVPLPPGSPEVRSQMLFESLAKVDYRDTALEHR